MRTPPYSMTRCSPGGRGSAGGWRARHTSSGVASISNENSWRCNYASTACSTDSPGYVADGPEGDPVPVVEVLYLPNAAFGGGVMGMGSVRRALTLAAVLVLVSSADVVGSSLGAAASPPAWSVVPSGNQSGLSPQGLQAVSCVSTGFCMAVG